MANEIGQCNDTFYKSNKGFSDCDVNIFKDIYLQITCFLVVYYIFKNNQFYINLFYSNGKEYYITQIDI